MKSVKDRWEAEGLPPPGSALLDRYKLNRAIARGGMAMVYEGVDTQLEREVAVKVLPERLKTQKAHRRFMREARLAAAVNHPNVVQTYDAGVLDSGAPFLVMELLRGETIYRILKAKERLPLAEAGRILEAVLAGIAEANKRGVVHRDLKPSNVLVLHEEGRVKVIDFGLSKDILERGPTLTGPREALGTPSYMAPEQVLASTVDARTDVWGAGVLFYEMITGERAFPRISEGPVHHVFEAILRDDPTPPSTLVAGLPKAVDEFVAKAIRKQAGQRFESANEMREACLAITQPGRYRK